MRLNRFTAAVISTSLILLLGFLSSQARFSGPVAPLEEQPAESALPAALPERPVPTPVPTAPTTEEALAVVVGVPAVGAGETAPLVRSPADGEIAAKRQLAAARATFALQNMEEEAAGNTALESPNLPALPADPLAKGGTVAFTLRQDGNADIYALTMGQPEPMRLTDHPADDRDPAWSRDGRQLAFASRRDGNWDLYILDLQNGETRRLTDDLAFDGGPSWSPDGRWLVFESYQEENLDLYIIAADGGSPPIRVTEHPGQDFSPDWSPDGRHIAFTSWRSGNKDVFIMSLDAVSDEYALNLTSTPDRDEDHAAFAPDGRAISYHENSGDLDVVYAQPLDAYLPEGEPFSVGQGRHASWSPDGSSLAYLHERRGKSFIIASSVDSWAVAPQAYARIGQMDDLAWSGYLLPRDLERVLDLAPAGEGEPLYVEGSEKQQGETPAYLLWKLGVDAPSPYLSDRVDQSFQALRQRVLDEVGWDFLGSLDNVFTPLYERPLPGEGAEDWSKAGRAFDFYYRYPISINPQVEVVREDWGAQTFWRIYLHAAIQDGSQGEPLRQMPWDFTARYEADPQYYDQGGKLKEEIPPGYYLDFTALAADYGWQRVPALDNWRTFFQAIRYWRFEKRDGLSWLEAMAEIHTDHEMAGLIGDS